MKADTIETDTLININISIKEVPTTLEHSNSRYIYFKLDI